MTVGRRERYRSKLRRLHQLSFEDRLEALFDPGSWELVAPTTLEDAWASALVTARGRVHGRPILAYASHYLVQEGTFGEREALRVAELAELAASEGAPLVALLHSNGARVAEHHAALAGNARMFAAITRLSGVVPQVTACLGLSLGVAGYLAALADFCCMIPSQSYTATTSPAVIKVATGQDVTLEELGGAPMHATRSGVAHLLAADDAAAIEQLRALLGYTAGPVPPVAPAPCDLDALLPEDPRRTYDVRTVIEAIVDADSFLEVHARWGGCMVVGLARLEGRAVGIIANQSKVASGAIDVTGARKASRFAQTMDSWGLPLVYLVDVPGIMVSARAEADGILDAGALLFHAVDTDVPRVSVVLRRCFGGAFVMLQARQAGGDRVFAYPQARVGIAGAEVSFSILHGKEHLQHAAADSFRAEALEGLRRVPSDAYAAVEAGIVDEVITPRQTRAKVSEALGELEQRPVRQRPSRGHANLPV